MPPFDMGLVQRGARLRRSPFYEAEQRHGPRGYTVYNHMLFPTNHPRRLVRRPHGREKGESRCAGSPPIPIVHRRVDQAAW